MDWKDLIANVLECRGEMTECPTCKNDIRKCTRLSDSKELYRMLIATRKEGFEEGKQAGRDELPWTGGFRIAATEPKGDSNGK